MPAWSRNRWVVLAVDLAAIAVLAFACARLFSIIFILSDVTQVHDSIPGFLDKVYGVSRAPSDDNKILIPALIVGFASAFNWSIAYTWEIMRGVCMFLAGFAVFRLVAPTGSRVVGLLVVAFTFLTALVLYSVGIRDHPTDFPDIFLSAGILWCLLNLRGVPRWLTAGVLMVVFGFNRSLAPFLAITFGLAIVLEAGGPVCFVRKFGRYWPTVAGLIALAACGFASQLQAKTIASRQSGRTYLERIQGYLANDRTFVRGMWRERRDYDAAMLAEWKKQLAPGAPIAANPQLEIRALQELFPLPSSVGQKEKALRLLTPFPSGLTSLVFVGIVGSLFLVSLTLDGHVGAKWLGVALAGIAMTNLLGGYLDEGRQSLWVMPFVALGLAEQISGVRQTLSREQI